MTKTNDIELARLAREAQELAAKLDRTMAAGRLNGVIDIAADLEHAARRLGWRAVRLQE